MKLARAIAKIDGPLTKLEKGFAKIDGPLTKLDRGFAKIDRALEKLKGGSAKLDGSLAKVHEASRSPELRHHRRVIADADLAHVWRRLLARAILRVLPFRPGTLRSCHHHSRREPNTCLEADTRARSRESRSSSLP